VVTQAVTPQEIWNMLIAEVGDTTPSTLAAWAPTIWDSYADKAFVYPRLQELYFHKRLIDIKLGSLANFVDASMSGDVSVRLSQRSDFLTNRKKEVQAEIEKVECWARSVRPPVVETLVATEIETPPPPGTPLPTPPPWDANSPLYKGDPYWTGTPSTQERTW